MSGRPGGGGGSRKVLLPPINFIFKLLQQHSTVQIWLFEQTGIRIEGKIRGFDEFMNLVIDEAVEVKQPTKQQPEIPEGKGRRELGMISQLQGEGKLNEELIQTGRANSAERGQRLFDSELELRGGHIAEHEPEGRHRAVKIGTERICARSSGGARAMRATGQLIQSQRDYEEQSRGIREAVLIFERAQAWKKAVDVRLAVEWPDAPQCE